MDMDELLEPDATDDFTEESQEPELDIDAMDDLDTMAMDDDEATGETGEPEEEEEDMVTAMLKAQGLDLAEDELDNAISSLIDNLDDDEEGEDEEKS